MALAAIGAAALVDLPVHLLADRDFECGRRDLVPAEGAEHEDGALLHTSLVLIARDE